jgi:hypothetical protein
LPQRIDFLRCHHLGWKVMLHLAGGNNTALKHAGCRLLLLLHLFHHLIIHHPWVSFLLLSSLVMCRHRILLRCKCVVQILQMLQAS